MRLPGRITPNAASAVLLTAAAAVLVTTPYDGGACRNVFSAYALPAASLAAADRPARSPALADAYQDIRDAEADQTALVARQAEVDRLVAAAEEAREAADEAAADAYESSWSTSGSWDVTGAEYDVEFAEDQVDYAEEWLEEIKAEVANDEYGFYTDADIAEAEDDLDDARAELAEAEAALAQAESPGGRRVSGPHRSPGTELSVGVFTDPEGHLIGEAGAA